MVQGETSQGSSTLGAFVYVIALETCCGVGGGVGEAGGSVCGFGKQKSLALFWGLPDFEVLGRQILNPTADCQGIPRIHPQVIFFKNIKDIFL